MTTAVDVAREVSPTSPTILWPADWPAPELVAWTLAHMLAETLPFGAPRDALPARKPAARIRAEGKTKWWARQGLNL